MSAPREVRVRVPASSANLGPGFDTLALALGLHDVLEVAAAGDGLSVEVTGEGAGTVPADERHLVVRSMRAAFDAFGAGPPGLRLRCENAIPQARGLGSSAAARVAGTLAAAALSGRDVTADRALLLDMAAALEGHADNAAACLLGGFVVAWNNGERFDAVRVDVDSRVSPVALVAAQESSTSTTRGLLPAQVPLVDAVFTGSRTALAVHAFTRAPDLLMVATEDRLHQDYRRPAYPASAELVDRLRAARVPAAISGAGPTVLAFPEGGLLPDGLVADGFTACRLPVDTDGAVCDVG